MATIWETLKPTLGASLTAFVVSLVACSPSSSLASWPVAAGVGGSRSESGVERQGAPSRSKLKPSVKFASLHSFGAGTDGAQPEGNLIYVKGTLYGTTCSGGKYNYGTVYEITKSGAENVLYSFQGTSKGDGECPVGGLIYLGDALYGTTAGGGTYGLGTVYRLTENGAETVFYSFQGNVNGGHDGEYPEAGLTSFNHAQVHMELFGTTEGGGFFGLGSIFLINLGSGQYSQFYYFTGIKDGANPVAALTNVGNILYVPTQSGGEYGYGTIFRFGDRDTARRGSLHSFQGPGADGTPGAGAGLTNVKGTLYGTTPNGGAFGYGTVFTITTTGVHTFTELYSFAGGSDGDDPLATLIDVGGTLYGTTYSGGTSGVGTVFGITASGNHSVLYNFTGPDGASPWASLTNIGSTVYGTTYAGGGTGCGGGGCGTVFSLSL